MTSSRLCTCAMGCGLNSMADPGVFGDDCSCWCHTRHQARPDPLLAALADARQRKAQAHRDIRLLLAYAREHVTPRPYRLADLADAAGISLSGVRTAYDQSDIDHAAQAIGDGQRHLQQAITALLAQAKRHAASGPRITAA